MGPGLAYSTEVHLFFFFCLLGENVTVILSSEKRSQVMLFCKVLPISGNRFAVPRGAWVCSPDLPLAAAIARAEREQQRTAIQNVSDSAFSRDQVQLDQSLLASGTHPVRVSPVWAGSHYVCMCPI